MSCLLFLSNQEASLFFRATCLQLEFFFKKETEYPLLWPQCRKAYPQTLSPVTLLVMPSSQGGPFL